MEPVTIDGLMGKAFMVGIKPHEFWNMTPRELMICIKAFELQHYGIEDGKDAIKKDEYFGSDEWLEKWQESYDKGINLNPKLNN